MKTALFILISVLFLCQCKAPESIIENPSFGDYYGVPYTDTDHLFDFDGQYHDLQRYHVLSVSEDPMPNINGVDSIGTYRIVLLDSTHYWSIGRRWNRNDTVFIKADTTEGIVIFYSRDANGAFMERDYCIKIDSLFSSPYGQYITSRILITDKLSTFKEIDVSKYYQFISEKDFQVSTKNNEQP